MTGIVDGMGSLGAALGQLAVPYLQVATDWRVVFYLFMGCIFLTGLCVSGICFRETKHVCGKKGRCGCCRKS